MNINPKIVTPSLMWLIVAVGAGAALLLVSDEYLFAQGPINWIVLGMGIANWLYIAGLALRVHRKAPDSAANIDALVTEGIYGVIRHPLYIADIALAGAIFVAYPRLDVLVAAAWSAVVFLFWAGLEERALEEKFMSDYRTYRSRVPMVIPRFTRK